MSEGSRGGERRRACAPKAQAPAHAREIVACAWQTRPSLGPSTRARQSSLCTGARERPRGEATGFGITVGQTHASGRNQHWGRTVGRSAARRVPPLPRGRGVARKKRKAVKAVVPARITSPGSRSYVVFKLQKSEGDLWPRISSAHALQKERSGSSERGPSQERRSAGETVGGRFGRKAGRVSSSLAQSKGEDRRRAQGGTRVPSSGHDIAHAVQWSRDRGCNGHRIP
jgi:hypothetical protein